MAYRYNEAYPLITRQVKAESWQALIYDAAGNLTDYERLVSGTFQYDGLGNRYR